jgi:N-acetylglutamate synthase-like GNAT family acetyltransferase
LTTSIKEMNFKIFKPATEEHLEKYYDLRYEILRKPWNQPKASTKDEWENSSIHVLMLNEDNEAIAVGRLQLNSEDEGQIRSMAVREDMQGKGLGSQIIQYIEQKAKEKKLKHILLDARINAVKFYENHGYKIIGDSYLLFGVIKHFRMRKEI